MSIKILIVDDSAVTRAVLRKTIDMTDVPVAEICEAANGKEALAVLQDEQIDLIFADLNMPEMNGTELATQVLSAEQSDAVPVIVVVTTEASPPRINDLLAKGVRGYVHKPFTPESIRDVLQDVLDICPA